MGWIWEQVRPGAPGYDASTIYKTYRGHQLSPAALIARETVQNSGDAAVAHAQNHPDQGLKGKVVFRFVDLVGSKKADMVAELDITGLRSRSREYSKLPLERGSVLDQIDDPSAPLRLLYAEDYGAHGLFGDIRLNMKSVLYQSMYTVGGSNKPGHAGGSFGFGKGAMASASRVHTVIAHSAFETFENDPIQERLVGATWWQSAQISNDHFSGRGDLGSSATGPNGEAMVLPFEADEARNIAQKMGFQQRDVTDLHDLGTSFLIVDTFIDADGLLDELARWWWPALEDGTLDIEVIYPDGTARTPQPASIPFLKPFLHAYRIATGQDTVRDSRREWHPSKTWRDTGDGGRDLGELVLTLPESTVGDDSDTESNGPLVALMRDPRMVISYRSYRMRSPLRGVFVAGKDSDLLLRKTEPSAHESWNSTPAPGQIEQAATTRAQTIFKKIGDSVARTVREQSPPPPKDNKALSHFAKLMVGFAGHKRGPKKKPTAGGEPIVIGGIRDAQAEVVDENNVRVEGRFTIAVNDKRAQKSAAQVTVSCQLHVTEDENPNGSSLAVSIKPVGKAHGFAETGDSDGWTGLLLKGSYVTFEVVSEPYPNLWTTTLQPVVVVNQWSEK